MATDISEAGVTPELEVFETGHLLLAKRMIETGHIAPPGMFQICLGIAWGQPATPEAMTYMRNLLPKDCTWFAFGISLWQFPMVAQAVPQWPPSTSSNAFGTVIRSPCGVLT